MARPANVYTVCIVVGDNSGHEIHQQRMTRAELEQWAASDEYEDNAVVFVGEPITIRTETKVVIGATKTRKPRTPKTVETKKKNGKSEVAKALDEVTA